MICNSVELKNYRNIEECSISLDSGVNIFIGDNAQGKTNLLEAIYTFSLGRSFRGAKEADVIKFGEDASSFKIGFTNSSRSDEQILEIRMARGRRRSVFHNGVKIERLSEMIGAFKAVLFCPEHLSLIKEGPSMRRNFLDVAISQYRPIYLKALQRYHAILEQRNKLIRHAEEDRKTLDATIELWSSQLAHEAAVIASFRTGYVKTAHEAVENCFSEMTGGREKVDMRYVSSSKLGEDECYDTAEVEKRYFSLLTENVEREIAAGSTLWGAHKDDIDILINEKSARIFASQGQQRSLALAMKLAEGDICYKECGERPVLLLDDVLSELDEKRRKYLLSAVNDRQVIITTCENIDFGNSKKIRVENGKYFI